MLKELSRRARIMVGSGVGALIIIGAALTGYSTYYANHIVPGVTFMGQPITVHTSDELRADLVERLKSTTVNFAVGEEKTIATLADLGVEVNIDQAIKAVDAPSQSFVQRFVTPIKGLNVQLNNTVDETKLKEFTAELVKKTASQVQDASVSFDTNSGKYTVTPATAGKAANITHVKDSIQQAVTKLAPVTLEVELKVEEPRISTEQAQTVADNAQKFVNTEISLTDGIETFTPSAADKATWVAIKQGNGKLENPTVDTEKVTAWVKSIAEKTNVKAEPGVNNVNSRGEVVSVHEAGTTGWTANNTDAVAKALEQSFRETKNYAGTFEYDQTKPEMTTRLIADGNATHIYAAAPGEKWIDINLSNATVTAYEGGTVVNGPIPMVPGAPETPTVTGKFRVWHQNPLQTMRGYNVDGTTYETPNVPWATYFHGDYAFHGAPWRSSFGWNGPGGSHGCVNMPVDSAEWIFNWANIGTVVVSHY